MRISAKTLQAYLDAKGAKLACWSCGTPNWATIHGDVPAAGTSDTTPIEMMDVHLSPTPPAIGKPYQVFPTLALYCLKCGNVRLIAQHMVRDFLNEQSNGGDSA